MKVLETEHDWQIKCRNCGWHAYPKAAKPGKTWKFNGNFEKPTFTPSMNETAENKEFGLFRRCHFTITDGMIHYHGDCTHELAGQTLPLEDHKYV